MFTIVMATRSGATAFAGPIRLLRDMKKKAANYANFEVILRVDDDDAQKPLLEKKLADENFPFRTVVVSGSRGLGYADLHRYHNDCYVHASPSHKIIFSLPEDVVIQVEHWDNYLIQHYNKAVEHFGHTIFTMHQLPFPGLCDNYESCLESPDSFPIYTRSWMDALGGFAYTAANDSWVQATHYFLITKYSMQVRYFLPDHIFLRHSTEEQDSLASSRWANERVRSHDLMRRDSVKDILQAQAKVLYLHASEMMLEKDESYQQTQYHYFDISNYLMNRFGALLVLMRGYHIFLEKHSADEIRNDLHFIINNSRLALRLKTTVPFVNYFVNEIYSVNDGQKRYLEKPYSLTPSRHALEAPSIYFDTDKYEGLLLKRAKFKKKAKDLLRPAYRILFKPLILTYRYIRH